MQKNKLTVYFEKPFWVAVYERISDGKLEVCKITFGTEPKDYEVYAYFLNNWRALRFSAPIKVENTNDRKLNPKRMHRLAKKETVPKGMGTKAQQALKDQQADGKVVRKKKLREEKEARRQYLFNLKQLKRKDKHKGH